MSSSAEFNKQF